MALGNKLHQWQLLGVLLLISSCSIWSTIPSTYKKNGDVNELSRISLTLAEHSSMEWSQVAIASEADLWSKEQLVVHRIQFSSGREALQAVLTGDADVATTALVPWVFSALADLDIVAIADVARQVGNYGVARKSVDLQGANDIVGKTVGATLGTTAHACFLDFADNHGLDSSEINIVNVAFPHMLSSLASESVDGIFSWEPNLHNAIQLLGDDHLKLYCPNFVNHFLIITSREYMQSNPEALQRFVDALLEADQLINSNPDRAMQLIASGTPWDLEVVQGIWKNFEFETSLSADMIDDAEWFGDFLMKNDLASEDAGTIDYSNYLDVCFLEK